MTEFRQKNSLPWDLIEKVVLVASLFIYLILFPPFFKDKVLAGHDIGSHLGYLKIFTDALSQGQFPVRWIEWSSLGQNQPLFNFYQPLFYYLAQIPHLFGADILNSLNLTVLFLWLLSGFLIYLFVKNLTKNKLAGGIASILYIFAPYHILDVFVRTAFPELAALAFVPGIFWALERYFATKKSYHLSSLALFFAAVFVSHPPTLIMFAFPVFLFLCFLLWGDYRKKIEPKEIFKKVKNSLFGLILGFGLASFFAIPAFLEQNLIKFGVLNLGYLDFHQHYACLLQLFIPNWGYKISIAGCGDQLSFQLGIINWLLVGTAASFVIYFWKTKIKQGRMIEFILWLFLVFCGLYMTTSFSQSFWEGLPYLSFIQFPWRFLSIAVFSVSVLGGLIISGVEKKTYQIFLFILIAVLTPVFIFSYLKPAEYLPANYFAQDSPNFYKGIDQIQQNKTSEPGYMPKSVEVLPDPSKISPSEVEIDDPNGHISVLKNNFHYKEYDLTLTKKSTILLFIHYFPGWKFYINGSPAKPNYDNIYNLVYLKADSGQNKIIARFENTPLTSASNFLSLMSIFIVLIVASKPFLKPILNSKMPANREEI